MVIESLAHQLTSGMVVVRRDIFSDPLVAGLPCRLPLEPCARAVCARAVCA